MGNGDRTSRRVALERLRRKGERLSKPHSPRTLASLAAPPRDCGASQSGRQRCTHGDECHPTHSFVPLFNLEVIRPHLPALGCPSCAHSTSITWLNVVSPKYPFHPPHSGSKRWTANPPEGDSSVHGYHPDSSIHSLPYMERVHPYLPGSFIP